MKSLYTFLVFGIVVCLSSCNVEKLISTQQYQAALDAAVNKLERKPHDVHALNLVKIAYDSLNTKSEKSIITLKEINTATSWERIVQQLEAMERRSEKLKKLPFQPENMVYETLDFRISEAKQLTAQKHVEAGEQNLKKEGKRYAQQAYYNFSQARRFDPNYPEILSKLEKAKAQSYIHILYNYTINDNPAVPVYVSQILQSVHFKNRSKEWLIFHTTYDYNQSYDFYIECKVLKVYASNNKTSTSNYTDKKEITTGYTTKKNTEGKVVTDANGNPVKIPIKKTVTANIKKKTQHKSAAVEAEIKITDNLNGNVFKTFSVTGKHEFSHEYASYSGDKQALSTSSSKLVKQKAVAFPSPTSILKKASQNLSSTIGFRINLIRKEFSR